MKKAWVTDYFDGRGYIYINRNRGTLKSLNYVEKQQISVNIYPNPIFKDADIIIADNRYYPHEFLRLCRNTKDGVTGKSITETNSDLLTLYYNTIVFEKHLMKTGGSRKGFLTYENRLSKEVIGDLLKRYQAYEIAIKSHFMQADEIRYKEDMKPLGLDWIELGLDSVLYNPETKEIYTPNTNQTATVEGRNWEDQDRDDLGRWTSNGGGVMHSPDRGGGFGGGSDLTSGASNGKISPEQAEKNRKELEQAIKSGKVSTKLDKDQQKKHKKGSEEYNRRIANGELPSYTELSNMEIQTVINEKSGTGIVYIGKDGQFREVVSLDSRKGMFGDRTSGSYIPTDRATIHYSKHGAHLVPAPPM